MATKTIQVDYLARVEGETAIQVTLPDPQRSQVELKIFEPPRFFEGFLVGRRYDEVGDIVARICGICPVSHMTTAICALEHAMGVEVSDQTVRLRRIACLSQILASHVVHLYALALPDYARCDGIAQMLSSHRQEIQRMLRLRKVLNELTALVAGGRALHPIGTVVGGFTRVPPKEKLNALAEQLGNRLADAEDTARMIAALPTPDLSGERELVALRSPDGYAINAGAIVSNKGLETTAEDYADCFEEEQVPYAMAKRARVRGRGALMVGALARLNLNFAQLRPRARTLVGELGYEVPDTNPFHNNFAQAIEIVHGIEECVSLLDDFSPAEEAVRVKPRAGEGGTVTEAPRGLLHHWYAVNPKGIVEKANIVTPTAHNFLSIEQDMKAMVEQFADQEPAELKRLCEMLVRAYDPCFSCSVH